MTAGAILALCCPPLTNAFVEELLGSRHVGPEEARDILAIVHAWGEEPGGGRSQIELRADIRARVLAYLEAARAPYHCHSCQKPIASVFYVDGNDNEICKACFDASRPVAYCENCAKPCPADDRLPTRAGGVAHAECQARLSNALGYQASALLSGRGLGVLKGGRS